MQDMNAVASTDQIRAKIKEVIASVADIDAAGIADDADLRRDLNLDSLSLLEIGVDVDYAFQLGIEDLEDRLANLETLDEVVALVERLRAERQPAAAAVA
jgi:acyl carrier protein